MVALGLKCEEFAVQSAIGDQTVMCTFLHNAAFIKNTMRSAMRTVEKRCEMITAIRPGNIWRGPVAYAMSRLWNSSTLSIVTDADI